MAAALVAGRPRDRPKSSRCKNPSPRKRAAERFLIRHGLRLVATTEHDAVTDLVMSHGDELVFVEVRLRSRSDFGDGAATVDQRKQNRLVHTAVQYLAHHGGTSSPCRFDVVSVSRPHYRLRLEWIRNAFSP